MKTVWLCEECANPCIVTSEWDVSPYGCKDKKYKKHLMLTPYELRKIKAKSNHDGFNRGWSQRERIFK